jgi:hypothetical protein
MKFYKDTWLGNVGGINDDVQQNEEEKRKRWRLKYAFEHEC